MSLVARLPESLPQSWVVTVGVGVGTGMLKSRIRRCIFAEAEEFSFDIGSLSMREHPFLDFPYFATARLKVIGEKVVFAT